MKILAFSADCSHICLYYLFVNLSIYFMQAFLFIGNLLIKKKRRTLFVERSINSSSIYLGRIYADVIFRASLSKCQVGLTYATDLRNLEDKRTDFEIWFPMVQGLVFFQSLFFIISRILNKLNTMKIRLDSFRFLNMTRAAFQICFREKMF